VVASHSEPSSTASASRKGMCVTSHSLKMGPSSWHNCSRGEAQQRVGATRSSRARNPKTCPCDRQQFCPYGGTVHWCGCNGAGCGGRGRGEPTLVIISPYTGSPIGLGERSHTRSGSMLTVHVSNAHSSAGRRGRITRFPFNRVCTFAQREAVGSGATPAVAVAVAVAVAPPRPWGSLPRNAAHRSAATSFPHEPKPWLAKGEVVQRSTGGCCAGCD
jgi:hypothetical protein